MTTYTGNGIRTRTQKEGADNSRTVKCINCNAETGTGTGRVARTREQEFEANNFHTFKILTHYKSSCPRSCSGDFSNEFSTDLKKSVKLRSKQRKVKLLEYSFQCYNHSVVVICKSHIKSYKVTF